jgi:hypothetical protein
MREAQPSLDANRRHPNISHEELRRQLIEADEERYRLRAEIAALSHPAEAPPRWRPSRAAILTGTTLVFAMCGGLIWMMCPPAMRAETPAALRVESVPVTARVVTETPSAAVELRNAAADDQKARTGLARPATKAAVSVSHVARAAWRAPAVAHPAPRAPARSVPRPLSPGQFGRKTL